MKSKSKKKKDLNPKVKKIIMIVLILILVGCAGYFVFYEYHVYKGKQNTGNNILDKVEINEEEITETKSERMLKLESLHADNSDIIGWIEIDDTRISYPVLQGSDNSYYLTHDYKKSYSTFGSIFLDKDFDLENGSSNYLIFGHRDRRNGLMFEDLIKYAKEDFYKNHKKFKFTTLEEDSEYEILAIFYSRVYYKDEKNVFRYYYFVNANNENEYNDYVNNAKKASIYDTGVTAKYGDQLLTLSTCEYSQTDGRFVVVAKKVVNN